MVMKMLYPYIRLKALPWISKPGHCPLIFFFYFYPGRDPPGPGDVREVRLADERQQVMLAHRGERDVPDEDDLVVLVAGEDAYDGGGIDADAREYLIVHRGDPARGAL